MRKVVASCFVAASVLATATFAVAAEPAPTPAAPPAAEAAKQSPSTARSDAAEARYRAWSEREHA